jgi:hypothetical protein
VGIRLWKKLGWGLTGLKHDEKGRLTDSRINMEAANRLPARFGPEYRGYLKGLREAEEEHSLAWVDLSMTIAMVEAAEEADDVLPRPVTRESEAGLHDLLLIQPVGFSHWSRYGDQIDQTEENLLYPDGLARMIPSPYGIYPFEGLYMDSRDGRRLDTTAKRLIERMAITTEGGEKGKRQRDAAEHLSRVLGFDNTVQALDHMVPVVPPDVRYVISWLNLFNEPDLWLQLRPMLYVYWS